MEPLQLPMFYDCYFIIVHLPGKSDLKKIIGSYKDLCPRLCPPTCRRQQNNSKLLLPTSLEIRHITHADAIKLIGDVE